MTFRIVMENAGGELDSQPARDGSHAVQVLVDMIESIGELADGDIFRIIDEDE